ncbi:MAG: hypothetical protein ACLP7P_08610 [Rhodomicrobium sp.]
MANDPYAGLGTPAQASDPYAGLGTPVSQGAAYVPLRDRVFERPEDEALYQQTLAGIRNNANPLNADPHIVRAPQYDAGGNQVYPDNSEQGMQRRAREAVIRQRAQEAEQKAFEESRSIPRRIGDPILFAADMPVRAMTGGEYGLADIAEAAGSQNTADALRMAQSDFARANPRFIEGLKTAGDVSLGIPALSGLGAPLEATAAAALEARGASAMARAQAASTARGALTDARLEDLGAFERSGVKPFGPAFTEAGTAGTIKQLSEAPIVGMPVRNALGQAIEETRDAGERLAAQYGDASTYRDAGQVVRGAVQQAVEDARDAVSNLPGTGTAGSYRDAGNAAQEGLQRFSDARSADTIGDTARNLSDADIADIVSRAARETSIRTKQDALYERAWRGIPEDMRNGRAVPGQERFLKGFVQTRELLQSLANRNAGMYSATRDNIPVDPTLAYPVRGGIAGRIVEDIIRGQWRGNLQDMRNVRSFFRRTASGISDSEANTLQLSDYRRMQSAMTQDIIRVLQSNADNYAARGDAATATRVQGAIHDFRRADQFTRASAGRLDALEKLYSAGSPEALAQNILKDAQGAGRGNLDRLTALRRSLSDEDWNDVAGGILGEMGRPVPSARGIPQEAGFSLNNFIDSLSKLSPQGRSALFGHNPELARSLGTLEQEARTRTAPLERLYGTQAPEQIGVEIVKDAEGGRKGGNLDRLIALRRQLSDQEWGDVASAALREMGKPFGSARGQTQEAGFSVNSAMTRWQNMSPEGRRILFDAPDTGGRVQTLNDFIRVANRMANFEALANTSRSATNGLGMAGLASIFTAAQQALAGHPGAAAGAASVAGGMWGVGKLLTSPAYVRWLTRAVKLSQDPRAAFTLRDHVRELARLAAKDADPSRQAVATALAQSAAQAAQRLERRPQSESSGWRLRPRLAAPVRATSAQP